MNSTNTYLTKIKYILPTFLYSVCGTVIALAFIRWAFFIQFHLFDINEEVWEIWIPLIAPWISITIWLRKRFRILTFKKYEDRRRFLYQMIAWGTMTGMLITSQRYLTTATGKLLVVKHINEIEKLEKVRYYKVTEFYVPQNYGGSHTNFKTTGKYNENLNFDVYFVTPILSDTTWQIPTIPKCWYGVKFGKLISNRLSDEEKESQYQAFYQECLAKMRIYNFYSLDHFECTPPSENRTYFKKAVEAKIDQPADKNILILEPVRETYEARNGNKLPWIFGSFGIGLLVLLLAISWSQYDSAEHKRQLLGKKPKHDDLMDVVMYLIPKGEHFATSIIIDLNILVLLLMILSGMNPISPNGHELLHWGANRRLEVADGEWWRLLTSMFLHGGIMHLFLNIYGLVFAGLFVEVIFGRIKFFILYLLSGICGSLASIWWHTDTISVGASGAIFGLFGAILGLLITETIPTEGRKSFLLMIGGFVGINLLFGLTGGIDNAAHIGGLLSGAIIGIVLYKIGNPREKLA